MIERVPMSVRSAKNRSSPWTFPVDMDSQIFQEVNTVVVRMSI